MWPGYTPLPVNVARLYHFGGKYTSYTTLEVNVPVNLLNLEVVLANPERRNSSLWEEFRRFCEEFLIFWEMPTLLCRFLHFYGFCRFVPFFNRPWLGGCPQPPPNRGNQGYCPGFLRFGGGGHPVRVLTVISGPSINGTQENAICISISRDPCIFKQVPVFLKGSDFSTSRK